LFASLPSSCEDSHSQGTTPEEDVKNFFATHGAIKFVLSGPTYGFALVCYTSIESMEKAKQGTQYRYWWFQVPFGFAFGLVLELDLNQVRFGFGFGYGFLFFVFFSSFFVDFFLDSVSDSVSILFSVSVLF
jgi:hypothetical protein